jgi:ATP-binding cassette subfamily B protein
MQILDRVVTSGSVDTLILLTIITFVATVTMISLEGCRSLAIQKIGEWLEKIMSDELIGRGLALTIQNPGTSGSQILRDMSTIRGFISSNALVALFDIPWALMFFVLMIMINSTIAFIAFIGIILVVLLAVFNEFATSSSLKLINEMQVKNYGEIEAAIRNAEVVESMGMGNAITRMWKRKNTAVSELQNRSSILATIINSISKLLRTVLNTFILAGGIYISLNNHTTVGGILACSMLMGRVMAPVDIIISSSKMISGARTSYSRLQGMLVNMQLRNSAMELPAPLGRVSANQVVYYPSGGQRSTIKGVSFEINPGEVVGVIGPSGCGKSTLMKLIVGVWKCGNGAIRLDGADVYTWNRDHFGKYVGYLPQDIELFNVSIKSNISRLSDEIDPMLVVLAAKVAGVHELILSLPNGYDSIIGYGPGSVMLSGGQKQRIALARAFYGDMRLLVLDEPNSNLDQQGEQSLMSAIHMAKQQKKTVIFTTHKMNLLALTDKILVMQDGLVVGFGPRDEILNQMVAQQQATQKAQVDAQAGATGQQNIKIPKQQVAQQAIAQQKPEIMKESKSENVSENKAFKAENSKSENNNIEEKKELEQKKEEFKPNFGFSGS